MDGLLQVDGFHGRKMLEALRKEMNMPEDPDRPAASDDLDVQTFLDIQWREAMRASRACMEALRSIYPELVVHLPETASTDIERGLREITLAYSRLHGVGPEIIGQDAYDEYLSAQTARAIGA